MDAERTLTDSISHEVGLAVRRFRATCPDCGPFFHDHVGHHSTISESQMSKQFPRRHLKQLRGALSEDERKSFNQTLRGKREPKEGEVEHWLARKNAIRKT